MRITSNFGIYIFHSFIYTLVNVDVNELCVHYGVVSNYQFIDRKNQICTSKWTKPGPQLPSL